jgi:hypothetical protein
MSSNAASAASKAQQGALTNALDFQRGVYATAQGDLNPYISGGQSALSALLGAYGLNGNQGVSNAFSQFQQTPAYQFALGQGNLALTRQLASMGLNDSGAALKEGVSYNQGYASQNYGNFLSGIGGIANTGLSAAGTLGGIGTGTGSQVGQTSNNLGAAAASGIIGSNNALNTGIGNALGALQAPNTNSSSSALSGLTSLLQGLGQTSYGPTQYSQLQGSVPAGTYLP